MPIYTDVNNQRVFEAWVKAYADSATLKNPRIDLADRRVSDSIAAWHRWHEPELALNLPSQIRTWFLILEAARVETLAARDLVGISYNLTVEGSAPVENGLAFLLYHTARLAFQGEAPSANWLNSRPGWGRIQHPSTSALLRRFRFGGRKTRLNASEALEAFGIARHKLESPEEFLRAVYPLLHRLVEASGAKEFPKIDLFAQLPITISAELEGIDYADDRDGIEMPGHQNAEAPSARLYPGYSVYHTGWDEEFPASHWLQPEDALAFDKLDTTNRTVIRRLARRLRRRLDAAQRRRWVFDLDEGLIDNRRLAGLVGDNPNSRIFRNEEQTNTPGAAVTFLVDQSGSMRGERQQMAATIIDVAVHTLELCGISCEVLGYTTVSMMENPVSELWNRRGRPDAPGRLNALRHVIYKTPEQLWRRQRRSLGLMLRSGFGCENIDGESLDWAARRLGVRREKRKALLVLCDGAPYDEATAEINGRSYLERHLMNVIEEVGKSGIELLAIGASVDSMRFFQKSKVVNEAEGLGPAVFRLLDEVLLPGDSANEIKL